MIDDTASGLAAELFRRAARYVEADDANTLASTKSSEAECRDRLEELRSVIDAVPHGAVTTFDDLRALAWFANRQLGAAFTSHDPEVIRAAADRAYIALHRLAKELNATGIEPPKREPLV